jgi:glucose-6-phosphate isomerase
MIANAGSVWRSKPQGSISTIPRTGSRITLRLLLQLAQESGLRERIDAMFRGDKINVSENRAVLHPRQRGENVVPITTERYLWSRTMPLT